MMYCHKSNFWRSVLLEMSLIINTSDNALLIIIIVMTLFEKMSAPVVSTSDTTSEINLYQLGIMF